MTVSPNRKPDRIETTIHFSGGKLAVKLLLVYSWLETWILLSRCISKRNMGILITTMPSELTNQKIAHPHHLPNMWANIWDPEILAYYNYNPYITCIWPNYYISGILGGRFPYFSPPFWGNSRSRRWFGSHLEFLCLAWRCFQKNQRLQKHHHVKKSHARKTFLGNHPSARF